MSEPMFASSIDEALDATAARSPEWGAGPSAALGAACAAALATMCARYAQRFDAVVELEDASTRLRELADADGPAFAPLLAAWALPEEAPERSLQITHAARGACAVPLEVAGIAARVTEIGAELYATGQRDLRGDAAAAVDLADAATRASARLVRLNAGSTRAPDLVGAAARHVERARVARDRLDPA